MEAVAVGYRWPPSELYALDLDDLETWGRFALERLKHPHGHG